MPDTFRIAVVSGIFAVLGAVGGAAVTGWSGVKLAEQKFYSDLVLRALEADDPAQRLEMLQLLVETNLIRDGLVREGLTNYASARKADPSTIPQLPSASPLYRQRGLGSSRVLISNPSFFENGNIAIFGPPLVRGKRLLISDESEWGIFCREAGYLNEDESKRETETVNCNTEEVEVAAFNYAHGGVSQGYILRTLSNKLLMCRNGTMEVAKTVVCYR